MQPMPVAATDDNQNFLIKNAECETCIPIKHEQGGFFLYSFSF